MTSAALSSLLIPVADGPPRACSVVAATSVSWHVYIDQTESLETEPAVSVISVQLPPAERLPCSLLVDTPPGIRVGDRGWIGNRLLGLGSVQISSARWFRPARPRIFAPARFLAGCRPLPSIRLDEIGLSGCANIRPSELLGRGPGLTPAGDDVLAAGLVVRHALGIPTPGWPPSVSSLAAATTPLSAQLLRCAAEGFCCDRLASLMRALDQGHDSIEATERLVALGGTTGTAMLMGLKYAAEQFVGSRAA